MAPRQLFSQPMEDDNDPEPGSKRVRPSSTDEGSMQVQLRARASACGTSWPGPAHWLALLALAWANGQSSPLLAREKCAANTLLSTAAPPFTTTASAVHDKPLRRLNLTLEQFVAFKWSFPKKLEILTPEALTISTLGVHQTVPLRIDPFEPTEAELAGDVPPSEHESGTERQACTRLAASRDTTSP
eukprot:scaffold705_cov119-Isochrysis_galbana.AAC.6